MEVKTENNGTPLPQRIKQNANQPEAEEKKPRFGNQGGQGNQGGGNDQGNRNAGGGGGGGNRNQNRGNRFGNRNQNMGGRGGNIKSENDIPNLMDGLDNRGGNDRDNRDNRGNDRRGQRGGGGGNRRDNMNDDRGNYRGKGEDHIMNSKLKALAGPTHELPPIDTVETKFSGRNRLYIGNLTNDVTEEELKELFKPYGEIAEAFINAEKNFAFLKVDYHANAERAKRELDGSNRKNRQLRIRFAPNATIVRVKNLTPYVSNELLFKAFEIFGPVERAVIIVDDRGKPTGEGIVEFARKAGASAAIRACTEKCFFLTASLRPCVVEPFEINDDTDGMPDKLMNKKTQEFSRERQVGPRFAEHTSFEHEYGTRWKQLHELFKQKHESLKRELQMEEEKLEAQMEFARYEHETELLREQLRKREEDRDRQRMEWEMRQRQHDEMRNRESDHLRRQQEEMQTRLNRQDEEMKRRQQENTLFMQAQQLNSLLDQQEFGGGGGPGNGPDGDDFNRGGGGGGNRGGNFGNDNFGAGNNQNNNGPNQDQGFMPGGFDFGNQNNQQQNQQQGGNVGGPNQRQGMSRWNDRRNNGGGGGNEDFQNKRRRF
ncbi:hrp65 protein-like isoform X2 [Condylostylus longicornis]|uniref:hrp65 protein-like isoform X2 n=1 Tax=Condylostylus longicornis TaxID=2530218 RepID=UPI00244E31E6|nr:hrp65 protein-like isoform X2 [Condylostylus longicornis]